MNRLRKVFKNPVTSLNVITVLLGLIMTLICLKKGLPAIIYNILLSVGCSLIATGIISFITSIFIFNSNEIKEIINEWRLKAIYRTKSEMNKESNKYLDEAKHSIDIIAIGMSNFLSAKGQILKTKSMEGIKIRIISCNNIEMLSQREKDESIDGNTPPIGAMKKEVQELNKWVKNANRSGCHISLKFQNSYPGFSYLKIDDHVFFGANLPLFKSQQNFAFEFQGNGNGGIYLNEYFNTLWNNENICSDDIGF
ncbi:hypothetical protein [Ruminococcus flavefaciens]|uniref:Uncharacterized protein n=1 Tax=Ruminococcus flavefaciens 007c TaxID=1341157 RepID=W7V223_RUMFL|nr:hypothetical protein [Ruminococcus flavefaciens]EWM55035.1 hypothetical protein RF007C_05025 [Ruminococcus flavefaciens 007c]